MPEPPMTERVAVLGLGYVGWPVLQAFARVGPAVGFDINPARIAQLHATGEALPAGCLLSADPGVLAGQDVYIITVPTPVDASKAPDLRALLQACTLLGPHLRPGVLVVLESTVYPGFTMERFAPALAAASGLRPLADFAVGYSPERINPGDAEHTLENTIKVVAGHDAACTERLAALYGRIVQAGVWRASSMAVAETAKVTENVQRDLNIALVNELALICDRLGIATDEVLACAGTKWNFLPFRPGLVGGHCISVDPYYLTSKAQALGYNPQVILAGRRINDSMGRFVAQKVIQRLCLCGIAPRAARVGVLGLAFKEGVADCRESRVRDVLDELEAYGIQALIHDPLADPEPIAGLWGRTMSDPEHWSELDVLLLAVPHRQYLERQACYYRNRMGRQGLFADLKAVFRRDAGMFPEYWSL